MTFHVKHGLDYARSAASWAGVSLDDTQCALLEGYADWLIEEAIPAGGLGPKEAERVWDRHIADSLTFAVGLPSEGVVVDGGTGVGLPGVPLAIARPDLSFWLVDRGGRRTRLIERALAILDLPEVVVIRRDVYDLSGSFNGLVFRGALPRGEIPASAQRLLAPGGTCVLGLSRRPETPDVEEVAGMVNSFNMSMETVRVPDEVLDGPAWLLKITNSGN